MNNTFTCIIIDDEEHAIGLLRESIAGLYSNIEIIGAYTSWKDGLEAVRSVHADLLFLDISIGGKNGMDILKIVPQLESEIIFVTAYAEYALDAFKFSATGYVVKPVGDAQLGIAIDKAIERVKNKRLAKQKPAAAHVNSKIGIPHGNGINYYEIDDIIYFEAENNYTRVVTQHSDLLSSYNIGKFNTLLEGLPFYQVHRSYVVNLNFIVRYEAVGVVIMSNKKEIPVARSTREDFLKLFANLQFRVE